MTKAFGESVVGGEKKPLSFQRIAPLTTNAYGGRKNIHENGWWIIPSSQKSIESTFDSGRMSFRVAKAIVVTKLKGRAENYPSDLQSTVKKVHGWGVDLRSSGTDLSGEILEHSIQLTKEEWSLAKSSGNKAKESLVYGYIHFTDREEEDRTRIIKAISTVNETGNSFSSSTNQLFTETVSRNSTKLKKTWGDSYRNTVNGFLEEYEESGEKENSLFALWDIFQGYTVAVKEAVFSPLFGTTTAVGETVVVGGVFVPVAHSATFLGQTMVTSGLVLFYPAQVGYRVISPSLEAGFFGSIALLTASATAPTIVSGTGLSAFNQITVVTGVTGAEAVGQVGGVGIETTALASGMVYDVTTGTAESAMYGMKAGLILSYAGLTVLPTHLLLTTLEGPIFLAYDGPRVVIAYAQGNYAGFETLPTGTVVDLEEAKNQGKIKILTSDPALVKKVIDAEIREKEKELKRTRENSKK